MAQIGAASAQLIGFPRRPVPGLFSTIAKLWRDLVRDLTDSYRPERHYMRGPGPKWRAKHAAAGAPATDLVGSFATKAA